MDIISILIILAAVFVGWGIGANDAANAIGVIVGSRSLRYRIAVSLVAVFMLLGALLQGHGVDQPGEARRASQRSRQRSTAIAL